jgi:hypothetical protein
MDDKLELSLLENSLDSLQQGLKHYQSALDGEKSEYKHAVLNFALYIELSLKYFISKINPILIYKDAFSKKEKLDNTISLQEAVYFLKHLNQIKHEERREFENQIDWLRKTCNKIKHHKVEMSTAQFKKQIGHILHTLDWLYDDNEISILDKLPQLILFVTSIKSLLKNINLKYSWLKGKLKNYQSLLYK